MKARIFVAATLLSSLPFLVHAESPQVHDAHHPNPASESAPRAQAPNGVMGQGMMGPAGAMGSGAMMNMMGGGMPMMAMMQTMMGSGGMATIDRVEGRIAFLKTELKITDAQGEAWKAFADVLRSNAKKLGELRSSMAPQASLADRLTWQEKWLTARSENTRAVRVAYAELGATLSDDQKASAEQLLAPHMGMMSMMSGMGSGQPMGGMGQMGNTNSGPMPMSPVNPMTTGKMPMK